MYEKLVNMVLTSLLLPPPRTFLRYVNVNVNVNTVTGMYGGVVRW